MAKQAEPTFNVSELSTAQTRDLLKETRARGTRASKYSPIYDRIEKLSKGKFVVISEVDKSTKSSLYQSIARRFDDMKFASAREKNPDAETYVIVIGHEDDYSEIRQTAKKASK